MTMCKRKRSCEAAGCDNTDIDCDLTFFSFPRNKEVLEKWISSIKFKDSSRKNRYICAEHFEERYFTSTIQNRLLPYAIPTLQSGLDNLNDSSDCKVAISTGPMNNQKGLVEGIVLPASSNDVDQQVHIVEFPGLEESTRCGPSDTENLTVHHAQDSKEDPLQLCIKSVFSRLSNDFDSKPPAIPMIINLPSSAIPPEEEAEVNIYIDPKIFSEMVQSNQSSNSNLVVEAKVPGTQCSKQIPSVVTEMKNESDISDSGSNEMDLKVFHFPKGSGNEKSNSEKSQRLSATILSQTEEQNREILKLKEEMETLRKQMSSMRRRLTSVEQRDLIQISSNMIQRGSKRYRLCLVEEDEEKDNIQVFISDND